MCVVGYLISVLVVLQAVQVKRTLSPRVIICNSIFYSITAPLKGTLNQYALILWPVFHFLFLTEFTVTFIKNIVISCNRGFGIRNLMRGRGVDCHKR